MAERESQRCDLKPNEWMDKKPNQNSKSHGHRHPPRIPLTTAQSYPLHTRLLLSSSRSLSFYNAKHAKTRRSTIQYQPPPHSRAHSLLKLQLSIHHHPPPRIGSKTPPCLIQSWPYLTSRASRYSHPDGSRALASPRFAFVRQTTRSLC